MLVLWSEEVKHHIGVFFPLNIHQVIETPTKGGVGFWPHPK